MTLRPTILAGLLFSQFALAANANEEIREIKPATTLTCTVDAVANGEILQDASFTGSMLLQEDGQFIHTNLLGDDPQYEVLVQYYRSEMEDDGSIHERIEVAISDLKKDIQEDYISSKVKSLMFVSALPGTYTDSQGNKKLFDTVIVECHPSN